MESTTTVSIITTTTLAPEVDREWEDLVLAGPAIVTYLSLSMMVASHGDQPLTPSSDYNVTYISNIHSLHSILLQIYSAMQDAFQVARNDHFRVKEYINHIPRDIKAALYLIQKGPHDMLETLLPYTLDNVERAAKESATISKPIFNRFMSVGLLLEEFVTVLASTIPPAEYTDYFIEVNALAIDMKAQWNLLIELFKKLSERTTITQTSVLSNFIEPINLALKSNGFNSQTQRAGHLDKLIPFAINIDQSSYLLKMMIQTYEDIHYDYVSNQIYNSNRYLYLEIESERVTSEREIWKTIVSQSVKIARLAQTRHNDFIGTSSNRQEEYSNYFINI